jgi:NADH-quinone oxidoreductase subunit J
MSASAVVFYVLSVFVLATAVLAVTSRGLFRSAIWLLFSLTGIAGIYFWLGLEFIAAVQIVVYVGGIVVLIIFSIFLTQQAGKDLPRPRRPRTFFSASAVCLGFVLTCLLIRQHGFPLAPVNARTDMGIATVGLQLLSISEHGYALPFEVVSILLLAAMVACIVIAVKVKPGEK